VILQRGPGQNDADQEVKRLLQNFQSEKVHLPQIKKKRKGRFGMLKGEKSGSPHNTPTTSRVRGKKV